jgi:hypothetical protein
MPDSCTHIVGECPDHEALRISRHNVACQRVNAAIRKTANGEWALQCAVDLILAMADKSVLPITTRDSIESLSPTSKGTDPSPTTVNIPHDWFAPLPTAE